MTSAGVVTLGDIVELTMGFAFKSEEFSENQTGIKLLRGENIAQGTTRWDNTRWWPTDSSVESKYALRVGDVVLSMDRPWIDAGLKFATIRPSDLPALLVQRVALLRARPGTDQRYLSCVVSSRAFTEYVLGVQTGTSIPHISGSQIARYSLSPHTLSEQRAIAEVLGAFDDKIAANTKLVQVSEELASVLFHDELRAASWSDKTFDDLASVSGGGTPSTKVAEYWDGDVHWATPTDVTGLDGPYLSETIRRITKAGLSACSSALFEPGAILMTSRATIGAFAVAQLATAVNQGFIVVQPKDTALKWWLFHEMRSRVDEFISLANGATFLELSRGNFRKLKVRLAEEPAMREFGVRVDSLHAAASSALQENRTLTEVREALLPPLMSGRLRVKDAEKVLEGVL